MAEYPQPDGKSRLFTYHAPADIYPYILAFVEEHGVSRNLAITEIIREHMAAAQKREARRKR